LPNRAALFFCPQISQREAGLILQAQEDDFGTGRFPRHKKLSLSRGKPEGCGIRHDHIRAKLVNLAQTLCGVAGLAYNLDIRLIFQQPPQAFTQQNVVVHKSATNLAVRKKYFR